MTQFTLSPCCSSPTKRFRNTQERGEQVPRSFKFRKGTKGRTEPVLKSGPGGQTWPGASSGDPSAGSHTLSTVCAGQTREEEMERWQRRNEGQTSLHVLKLPNLVTAILLSVHPKPEGSHFHRILFKNDYFACSFHCPARAVQRTQGSLNFNI